MYTKVMSFQPTSEIFISTFYSNSHDARAFCSYIGGWLVRIRFRGQLTELVNGIEELGSYEGHVIHIGGKRRGGRWRFEGVDQDLFTDWHRPPGDKNHCVVLKKESG